MTFDIMKLLFKRPHATSFKLSGDPNWGTADLRVINCLIYLFTAPNISALHQIQR